MKKFTLNLLALLAALASTGALAQNTPSFPIPTTSQIISTVIPTSSPSSPSPVAPGLAVYVIAGQVNITNQAGSTRAPADWFGYTTATQLPTPLPKTVGVLLPLPSAFTSTSAGNKATAIDCVVR